MTQKKKIGQVDVDSRVPPFEVAFRFTVPCLAVPGFSRLRVLVVEGGHDPDPCLVFAYGAVKEFGITILPQVERNCLPPVRYCKAGNMVAADSNLGPVNLVGVQGTSISDNTNCPSKIGIRNLTDQSAQLQPGGTYVLNLKATTCGFGWKRMAYAFADFNGNSVFEDSELLGKQEVDDRVVPVDVSLQFEVPCVGSGALVGMTRLRVFVVEGEGLNADPCTVFNYGAVKEFSLDILNKPAKLCSSGRGNAEGVISVTL